MTDSPDRGNDLGETGPDNRVRHRAEGEAAQVDERAPQKATERRKPQDELKRAHADVEQFFNAAVPLCVIDRDCNIVRVNQTLASRLQMAADSTIGRKCYEIWSGPACGTPQCALKQILSGKPRCEYEMDRTLPDGGKLSYLVTALPYRDADGRIQGTIESFIDITERKRAHFALRASEHRYRHLFEHLTDAAFVTDARTGQIVEANRRSETLLGRGRTEIVGTSQRDLHPADEAASYETFVRRLAGGDFVESWAADVVRENGDTVPVSVSAAMVTIGARTVMLGLYHDMTERVQMESLARSAAKLRAVRDLATGFSHNFNNLLSGVVNLGQFVRATLQEHDASLGDIDQVLHCAERASRLARQLREWTDPLSGALQPILFQSLVESVVARFRGTLESSVNLVPRVSGPPRVVQVSYENLLDALQNICENAREAMPDGGTLTIAAEIAPAKGSPRAQEWGAIRISDTGSGMDDEVRARVFEPFFSTKQKVGVGLSLSMTQRVVSEHGGRIEVVSAPGKGTTVTVLLPVTCQEDSSDRPSPETLAHVRMT